MCITVPVLVCDVQCAAVPLCVVVPPCAGAYICAVVWVTRHACACNSHCISAHVYKTAAAPGHVFAHKSTQLCAQMCTQCTQSSHTFVHCFTHSTSSHPCIQLQPQTHTPVHIQKTHTHTCAMLCCLLSRCTSKTSTPLHTVAHSTPANTCTHC